MINRLEYAIFIFTMRLIGLLMLFLFFTQLVNGQFYSGSYQEFGKNRVQYNQFQWKYQQFERFRVHYYSGEEELVAYCAKAFHREMLKIEKFFDYRLDDKLDLVVFTAKSKFTQSNIGITRENSYNVGGLTKVVGAKLFVYFEGTHEQLNRQIREVITEVMLRKMLFDGNWKDAIKSNSFSLFPEWYTKGFVAYRSRPWDTELDNEWKALVNRSQAIHFSRLSTHEITLVGHALWQFVEWNFGRNVIPQIIYHTRLTRNPNQSFRAVLGVDSQELFRMMFLFFLERYQRDVHMQDAAQEEKIQIATKKKRLFLNFRFRPDGRAMAYIENLEGRYWIKVSDLDKQKTKTIYRAEPRLHREVDLSFPTMAWYPQGKALAFSVERKGELRVYFYTPEDGKLSHRVVHNMDKILAMNYSPDGKHLILSAVRNGKSNLALYSIQGNSFKLLTDDYWDDVDPMFSQDGKHILFSSNRPDDSLTRHKSDIEPYTGNFDLFTLALKDVDKQVIPLFRLTRTPHADEKQPVEIEKGRIAFLSDANGSTNRMLATRDSMILSIDTAIHYRQVVHVSPLTNWNQSIRVHHYVPLHNAFYSLVSSTKKPEWVVTKSNEIPSLPLTETVFKSSNRVGENVENKAEPETVIITDSSENLSHVRIQEIRMDSLYLKRVIVIGEKSRLTELDKEKQVPSVDSLAYERPREVIYTPDFARDYLVTKLDNQFLNNTYQRFTGPGTTFFNPGLNALMRIGYSDVHEDIKLVGGIRIPFDLRSGEQLVELHFLKKRLDHKLILYRQSLRQNDDLGDEVKWQIHELKHGLSYPFSEIWSLRGTYGYRYDREIVLSRNQSTLTRPTTHFHQAVGKLELILDNARELGINLHAGTKFKLFAEYMHQFAPNRSTVNLGLDLRHYQPLVKQLIWVNRLSGATSLGNQRVVYYMGGVDNWLIRPNPHFDSSIDVDPGQSYGYQTLASPMRGFLQNSRNGNSFVAWNSELRFPVVSFLSKNPVKSELLRSIQLVAFMDVGTAWTGPHPYSEENYFNTQVFPGYPITVTLLNNREPIIMGFGTGIRVLLFGYYLKLDCGWGLNNGMVNARPRLQFSLGWDI